MRGASERTQERLRENANNPKRKTVERDEREEGERCANQWERYGRELGKKD